MVVEYEGTYQEMAERLRADGCDEGTVERFVAGEMEADERRDREGVTERVAWRRWRELPITSRYILLTQATCRNCGLTTFDAGYFVRLGTSGLVVEGTCAKCGARIALTRGEVQV